MWFSNLFINVMVSITFNDDDLEISLKENMHKVSRQPTFVLESLVNMTLSDSRCSSKIVCMWLPRDLKKLNGMNARVSATHGIYFKLPRSQRSWTWQVDHHITPVCLQSSYDMAWRCCIFVASLNSAVLFLLFFILKDPFKHLPYRG